MWWKKKKSSGEAILWHEEAVALQQRGKFKEARDKLEQAIKVFRETKNQPLLASSLSQLSQVYLHEGDIQKSIQYIRESVTIRTEAQDFKGLAVDYQLIGTLMMMSGQLNEAYGFFRDSLGLATLLNNSPLIASAESNLGLVAF